MYFLLCHAQEPEGSPASCLFANLHNVMFPLCKKVDEIRHDAQGLLPGIFRPPTPLLSLSIFLLHTHKLNTDLTLWCVPKDWLTGLALACVSVLVLSGNWCVYVSISVITHLQDVRVCMCVWPVGQSDIILFCCCRPAEPRSTQSKSQWCHSFPFLSQSLWACVLWSIRPD